MEYLGRYREIRRIIGPIVTEAREKGNLYQQAVIGMGIDPFLEMLAGRPDAGLRKVDDSLRKWTRSGYYLPNVFAAKCRIEIHLYRGDTQAAWDAINAEWPLLRKSLYLRLMGMCQFIYFTRAQCALALARTSRDRARLIRRAKRDARRLSRDAAPYAHAFADSILAGCAALKGDSATACALLEKAASSLDGEGMIILAATARWRLGQMTPGEPGRRLQAAAEALMREEGVEEPARFSAVFINGFVAA